MVPRRTRNTHPAPIPLHVYVEPGRGRIDLTKHKGGQEGFKKVVEDFTAAHPFYDRRNLELSEKVVLVGDPCVGKTCLVLRLIDDSYTDDYQSTIGVDFYWEKYTYAEYDFTLHVWDTAGQERFRALSKTYYRGAQACIASFDLGVPETLAHAKQSDMFHIVSATHAERVASELEAEYFEVSAKFGFNVRTLFDRVAIVLFERALLRAATEWKEERKKSELKLITPGKVRDQNASEMMVDGRVIGDLGAGKGTENWKEVKRASRKLHCCRTS